MIVYFIIFLVFGCSIHSLNGNRKPYGYNNLANSNRNFFDLKNNNNSNNNFNNNYNNNNLNSQYDFIVVGSGPTGSMTAITLADKGFKVLLMEAGPDYMSYKVTTPAFFLKASEEPTISWDFYVKHYPENTGLRQKVLYPRVSALGGCTLHNALIHLYPRKSDFDLMVKLTGDSSWDEKNMRKYFEAMTGNSKKLHDSLPMKLAGQIPLLSDISNRLTDTVTEITGNKGWLPLMVYNTMKLLSVDFKLLDILKNILLGPTNLDILMAFDINGYSGNQLSNAREGNFFVPMNVDGTTLKRKGIYELLIEKSKTNKNLHIRTNVFVTKILLDKTNTRALGVSFKSGKFLYSASPLSKTSNWNNIPIQNVYASKEVIISAGTFNTPQLMMLSGIGDSNHLRQVGIESRVHLPGVGRNMQDRYEVALNFAFKNDFALLDGCFLKDTDECFGKYLNGVGAYTFNAVLAGSLFKTVPNLAEPDLFMINAPIYFSGYRKGMTNDLIKHKNIYTLLLLKANTKNNAGRVMLRSKDPRDVPDINFNYFYEGGDYDMNGVIQGILNARQTANKFLSDLVEVNPGPLYNNRSTLEKYVQNTAWGHHACCTMKIGFNNDKMAVLDAKFRVRGVNNLRVADLSIFNKIPGYFPVLYLYMVGMKIGDTIANDYLKQKHYN